MQGFSYYIIIFIILHSELQGDSVYVKALTSSPGVNRTIQIPKKALPLLHNHLCKLVLFSNYRSLCVFVNELTQYFMRILHILLELVRFVLWRGGGG